MPSEKEQSEVPHVSYGWDDVLEWERQAKAEETELARQEQERLEKIESEIEIKQEVVYDPNDYQQPSSSKNKVADKPKNLERFECSTCKKSFKTRPLLNLHTNYVHTVKKTFKCEICKERFKSKSALRAHRLILKHMPTHKCPKCKKTFTIKVELGRHFMQVHEKKIKCKFCRRVFRTQQEIALHETADHRSIKIFKCLKCKKSFKTDYLLKSHFRNVHQNQKCPKCDGRFADLESLKSHLKIHK